MNIFIIPGNPPAVYFYEQWGREIIELHPGAQVRVSHYPNLKYGLKSEAAMTEVKNAHLKQMLEFHSEVNGPVIIIGHSLGGFFALKILEEVPELIERAILLHPFLRTPSLRGRALLMGVGSLWGVDRLHRTLIRYRKVLELLNADLPFVSEEEILRSFHLAQHELATIGRDRSPIEIRYELREKVRVFHFKKDDWCTPEVLAQLRTQVAVFECGAPHGFIVNENERKTLARTPSFF